MKNLFLFLLLFPAAFAFAQADLHCGTDIIMKRLYEAHPEIKARKDAEDAAQLNSPSIASTASYTIPVVFHILHQGGPENISDYQVIDAMRILNMDYAKTNPDIIQVIPSMQGLADSTKIQFVLATKDPNGNCTNGIKHYFDTDTDWDDQSPTLYSYTWDPTRYMNVYIVRTITLTGGFSAAGYTFFPGSFSPGDPRDAIVVLNNYFGSIGTGSAFQSRVLTHEVGHWLNLRHIFGNQSAALDCNGNDFVADTPPTPGYVICPDPLIPATYQLCTPGVDENFQNYMDYSYCNKMFTQGQGVRMRTCLQNSSSGRNNLSTNSNLLFTGVISPLSPCTPVADFNYDRERTCVGTPVTFYDASWNSHPTSYLWSFPGGTPSSSTDSMQVVTYATPGIYSATLTTSTSAGTSPPVTKTNIITVTGTTAQYQILWSEGFETVPIPNTDWQVSNSSGGSNWETSSNASYGGVYSAQLPLTNNTRNAKSQMISPSVNLSLIVAPVLSFTLAAAESNPDHINTLQVYATTDCGATWTLMYSKTGSTLITSPTNATPFIPFGSWQWRQETINLSAIGSASSASFKFIYIRDTLPAANNVFIDNINITGANMMNEQDAALNFSVFPNPSSGVSEISFDLLSSQNVKVEVTNVLGQQIESFSDEKATAGKHIYKTGNAEYAPGIYFITVYIDGRGTTKKVVVE